MSIFLIDIWFLADICFKLRYLRGAEMERFSEESRREKINFLLENWEILNIKDIMDVYAEGGVI